MIAAVDTLLTAAEAERDRRAETFPAKIADLRRGLPLNAETTPEIEALVVDYQCWVAIAAFIDSGQFGSFHGGTTPHSDDAPLVDWLAIERAAEAALAARSDKITKLEGQPNVRPEALGALRARRSCLFAIHRKVQLRRQTIDSINAEFRAEASERASTGQKVAA